MHTADVFGLDLADAVLLHTVQALEALWLATDDMKLMQACRRVGVTPETPIDIALRQQMAVWEAANLPAKGLPRVLRQIHQWLQPHCPTSRPRLLIAYRGRESPAMMFPL
jgi:hypothetical protein